MNTLTKGLLLGAAVLGVGWLATRDSTAAEPTTAEAWEAYLFSPPDAERKQRLFWVMAALYGRGLSTQPPSVARIDAAIATSREDEVVRAMSAAFGRPVTPTDAEVIAFARLPLPPTSQTRALPMFLTNRTIARIQEIGDQLRSAR